MGFVRYGTMLGATELETYHGDGRHLDQEFLDRDNLPYVVYLYFGELEMSAL
jgi:hypothetical protein